MKLDFTDRIVLVTGAAQGIGRAIAQAFQNAGARLHLADIDSQGVEKLALALGAVPHSCDLSDRAAAHRLVDDVVRREGRIDVLALAAGGVRGQVGRPIEEIGEQDWQSLFQANANSAFWSIQAAAPHMKAALRGRVVAIASSAGLRPSLTGIQGYTASKHALVGIVRQLSHELGPAGITVNAIAPGIVLSNPSTEAQWAGYGPELQQRMLDGLHLRRHGSAEDIAAAVLFFASEQAGWITGQVLSVDAGRS